MPIDMKNLESLCRRRGFIFQSSEIYGGIHGFWDYGPLGVELKKNIKEAWWQDMVRNPPLGPDGQEISMVGIDCALIMNPKVWEASGHVGGFSDPMVDCKETKARYRADQLVIFQMHEVAPRVEESIPLGPYFATVAPFGAFDETLIEPHRKQINALEKKRQRRDYNWQPIKIQYARGESGRLAI